MVMESIFENDLKNAFNNSEIIISMAIVSLAIEIFANHHIRVYSMLFI